MSKRMIGMNKLLMLSILIPILLGINIANASPVILPVINKDQFKACFFGWCQIVSPDFLLTDMNISTNYYNITNSTVYNISVSGANVSTTACGGSDKISAIDNATGVVTCSTDEVGITSESEPMWNGNYSSVAFTANQNQWNVNSSNYCVNVLSGSTCTNTTFDPFIMPTTCSDVWGQPCSSATLDDSFSGNGTVNGTQPNGCNGTQYWNSGGTWSYVIEAYINATAFHPNDPINVTCNFSQKSSATNFEYLWYYNSTDWINIQNWTDGTQYLNGINRSAVFNVNATEGTHIVRCIISYSFGHPVGKDGSIPNECANATLSGYYDNDDVNFTVTSNTSNITVTTCYNPIQNITANNSLYLYGYNASYFCPLNASACGSDNTSWNETLASSLYYGKNDNVLGFYNSTTLPAYPIGDNTSWNESRYQAIWNSTNLTYQQWNKTYADTLYNPLTPMVNISTTTCTYGIATINNATGVVTCNPYLSVVNVSNTSCSSGQHIQAINNSTGVTVCSADSTYSDYVSTANASTISSVASTYLSGLNNATGIWSTAVLPYISNVNISQSACSYGITSFNNATGVPTCNAFTSNVNVSTTSCSAGQLVSATNNATGVISCTADLWNTTAQMQTAVNNTNAVYNMTFSNATLNASSYIKIYNTTGLASCMGANATYSFMILSTC